MAERLKVYVEQPNGKPPERVELVRRFSDYALLVEKQNGNPAILNLKTGELYETPKGCYPYELKNKAAEYWTKEGRK